jgi:hypothetical protein
VDFAIAYPGLSKMAPKDWAITQSTTNLGGSQHHWTNQHTGIKHSLVEAIVMLVHLFILVYDLSTTSLVY